MTSMSCVLPHNLSGSKIVDYYARKASAGLIVSDPTSISPLEKFPDCSGIYTPQQVKEWRKVTEEVHDRHGKIFLQLWYGDDLPASISSVKEQDLATVVKLFRRAAQNALAADFDGIEINAAFRCLKDSRSESRHDLKRLMELLVLIIQETASVWDEDRVGVRIEPKEVFLGANISDLLDIFYDLCDAFNFYDIAYVHLIDRPANPLDPQVFLAISSVLRSAYGGTIISSCQDNFKVAQKAIAQGSIDLVSFDKLSAC